MGKKPEEHSSANGIDPSTGSWGWEQAMLCLLGAGGGGEGGEGVQFLRTKRRHGWPSSGAKETIWKVGAEESGYGASQTKDPIHSD